MSTFPSQLYRAEQVRALDRTAIEQFSIPGIELMQRAGLASFRAMRQRWPRARRMVVFCGAGNNGGDGYVIARLAHEAGLAVQVFQLATASRIQGDAKTALEQLRATPVPVLEFKGQISAATELVVDALLGTGLTGNVADHYALAINCINQHKQAEHCSVVSVDIPSGLHADTGCIMGNAVRADQTVTYIGMKQGLLTASGPDVCGELIFDDLQVDARVYDAVPASAHLLDETGVAAFFAPRLHATHKGTYGHVVIVGGNYGMAGAVRLAGEAALRAGAGKVTVACRPEHVAVVVSHRPELMCYGIDKALQLQPLLANADCVVVGPGLGQDRWAQELFGTVLDTRVPLIVDADALRLIARDPVRRDNWVLTPHPGEAAQLLGMSHSAIQQNRFAAVRTLQSHFGGSVVLKGNGSLVCDSQTKLSLCAAGNPGMASAGMGDVLSGIIAACVVQSGNIDRSVAVAVWLHARAGDDAAVRQGQRGLLAGDLMAHLQRLVNPT